MSRRTDLIILAVVTTFVVPLLAIWIPAGGLIITTPVLTGVAVGLFIRRTRRSMGVTLAFGIVPPIALLAYSVARLDTQAPFRVVVLAVAIGLNLVCGLIGAAIGSRSATLSRAKV
jgi:hypothetical protein